MNVFDALLLGVLQGLTEFIPVSSSGHLACAEHLLGITADTLPLHAFLHAGTLLAVAAYLRRDLLRVLTDGLSMLCEIRRHAAGFFRMMRTGETQPKGRLLRTNYRKMTAMILIALIPTAVIGWLLSGLAETLLKSVMYNGIGFFLTSILLLVAGNVKPRDQIPKDIPLAFAWFIGCAQGISVLPGISRAALTITAGEFSGFSRKHAVRFSYLLAVPAIAGSLLFEIVSSAGKGTMTGSYLGMCFLGMIASFLSGYAVIRLFLRYIRMHSLNGFAVYGIFMGILSVVISFLP